MSNELEWSTDPEAVHKARLDDRNELVDYVATIMQGSAKARSKDGMTGISDERAKGLALDVVDLVLRERTDLLRRLISSE